MNGKRLFLWLAFSAGVIGGLAAVFLLKNLWLGVAILFAGHAPLLLATLSPYSQWLGPVVTKFRTDKREVWLTIDDGPAAGETEAVLDVLDRFNAKATFFVIGQNAEKHPGIVSSIAERGHSIGNHTWSHPQAWWWALPRFRVAAEIDNWFNRVKSSTQQGQIETRLFRSPVGMKPPGLHPVLRKRGLQLIGWSARGRDGVKCDLDAVLARIQKAVEPGAIILLHECRGHAPELLERLLPWLKENGYRCVLPREEDFLCG